MKPKIGVFRVLLMVSLALFVASIFLPWLAERHGTTWGARVDGQFWSYQAIMKVSWNAHSVNTFILRFGEYWFVSPEYAYPRSIYYGWFFIFALQMIGIVAGVAGMFKGIENRFLAILTTTCLLSCLILCVSQFLEQSAANFGIGFWSALFSTILGTVPLWLEKLVRNKMHSLKLLLIVTAVPSVFLMFGVAAILASYIRRGGDFWFDWNRQLIGVTSQGGSTGMYISSFFLGVICVPLFFASISLLYREMQNRKSRKRHALVSVDQPRNTTA